MWRVGFEWIWRYYKRFSQEISARDFQTTLHALKHLPLILSTHGYGVAIRDFHRRFPLETAKPHCTHLNIKYACNHGNDCASSQGR